MTFISWNVNGIRAVEKKKALAWIDQRPPDFLGLQEIKAEPEQIPPSLFAHQYPYRIINPSINKGQSGVALFTHLPGTANACPHVDLLSEGRINEYHFGPHYVYLNVYFPNGKRSPERLAYKLAFYDRFLEHIDALRREGKSVIFGGDINTAHRPIDLARPVENEHISGFLPEERAWIDRLLAHGYVDTFRHVHGDLPDRYSWWSYRTRARERNVGWRIDAFFVSDDLTGQIRGAEILDAIEGSDHCPISLDLDLAL